jgi:hypothetical protein
MKRIEGVKCESTAWPGYGRWETTESEELDVVAGTSNSVMAGAKSNVDGVDAGEINDHKILLNGTRAGTGWALVTQLHDQTEILQRYVGVKGPRPMLNKFQRPVCLRQVGRLTLTR